MLTRSEIKDRIRKCDGTLYLTVAPESKHHGVFVLETYSIREVGKDYFIVFSVDAEKEEISVITQKHRHGESYSCKEKYVEISGGLDRRLFQ